MNTDFSVLWLILYGVLFAIIYRYIPSRNRSIYISIVSLLIYAVWAKYAIFVLIIELAIGWYVAYKIKNTKRVTSKRLHLIAGIFIVSAVLLSYKFFSDPVYYDVSRYLIPIGLSYYSFKIISYLIDCYRDEIEFVSAFDYLAYVSLFMQIVSGPISRYKEWSISSYNASIEDCLIAFQLIIKGLFYKFVIADRLAVYTKNVFSSVNRYNSLALVMAMFFYSIQLYADFAGYSDISIGLCRLYGFRVHHNFDTPYFSKNIKEFWNRWHISLSNWLKDYIYIPLGGNRKGIFRKNINILIVFLVSGIWHGSTSVYVIWGLWHAVWNILSISKWKNKISEIISMIFTFIIVSIGWLCFSLENVIDLFLYIKGMFVRWSFSVGAVIDAVMPFSGDYSCVSKLCVVCIMILFAFTVELSKYRNKKINSFIVSSAYLICLIFFGTFGAGSFIYANY